MPHVPEQEVRLVLQFAFNSHIPTTLAADDTISNIARQVNHHGAVISRLCTCLKKAKGDLIAGIEG
jgi:hypothetical protein